MNRLTKTFAVLAIAAAALVGWASTADAIIAQNWKIVTAHPGPLYGYTVKNTAGVTMTFRCTEAQYMISQPNATGKLISWQDGGPTQAPPPPDGDTKDVNGQGVNEEWVKVGNFPAVYASQ